MICGPSESSSSAAARRVTKERAHELVREARAEGSPAARRIEELAESGARIMREGGYRVSTAPTGAKMR